jgi:hypothetical protein
MAPWVLCQRAALSTKQNCRARLYAKERRKNEKPRADGMNQVTLRTRLCYVAARGKPLSFSQFRTHENVGLLIQHRGNVDFL